MINSKNLINISLIFVIILGVFLRLYNLNYDDLWFDEMATFWVTDPNISFSEMFERHKSTELAPQFYYIIIYFLNVIFGYEPEIGRYFSSIIGILSIFSVGYLVKIVNNSNAYKLSMYLMSLNVYLISYSMEMRAYMLVFFLSSLSLISIFKYINTKNKLFLFTFSITQTLAAFTHPFTIIIFVSIFTFQIYNYFIKKNTYDKNLNFSLALTTIFIFIITFLYYFNLDITDDYTWNKQPNIKFYTNFYFSKFFGSRLLGLIHLIILIYFIFKFKKSIFKLNHKLLILFIILCLSYIIPIVYGVYKPILNSKYIIFVIIPIITLLCVLVYDIKNKIIKNTLIAIFLIVTIGNQFTEQNFKQFYDERKYFKPQFNSALNYINSSDNKNYTVNVEFTNDNLKKKYEDIYLNYFQHLSKKNNYNTNFISPNEYNNINLTQIWILCSHLVFNENCKKIKNNQTIIENKNFSNIYMNLVKKN